MPNGRCRIHGGKAGRPVKTGRYSLRHRAALAEKQARFLADEAPGDLTSELALMRALLQDYLERFPDGQTLSLSGIKDIYGMVDSITGTVKRISDILNSTSLTMAEVQYLQARIADVTPRYIPDADERKRYLAELAQPRSVH